jgi:hypothetical protein
VTAVTAANSLTSDVPLHDFSRPGTAAAMRERDYACHAERPVVTDHETNSAHSRLARLGGTAARVGSSGATVRTVERKPAAVRDQVGFGIDIGSLIALLHRTASVPQSSPVSITRALPVATASPR